MAGLAGSKLKEAKTILMIWTESLYAIWRACNSYVFNAIVPSVDNVVNNVKVRVIAVIGFSL